MMVIRPVEMDDLDALLEMAQRSSGGITSLPPNRPLLRERIERSEFAFSIDLLRPKGEAYLFVLQNLETGEVVGCCGILSKTGGYEPLYAYKLATEPVVSTQVKVKKRVKVLNLERIYNGPTEVGSLFLMPELRSSGLGRLLSLSRFLFIGIHSERFETEVSALLRGYQGEEGSPFYETICRPFFGMEFEEADRLRYSDPRFIEDLVPRHPLYLPLLPYDVQKAVGQTHVNTEAAMNMLKAEGFETNNLIDIFDGGPFISAGVDKIRAIKKRRKGVVDRILKRPPDGKEFVVCNHEMDYRACLTPLKVKGKQVAVAQEVASALGLQKGDPISFLDPHPPRKHS